MVPDSQNTKVVPNKHSALQSICLRLVIKKDANILNMQRILPCLILHEYFRKHPTNLLLLAVSFPKWK